MGYLRALALPYVIFLSLADISRMVGAATEVVSRMPASAEYDIDLGAKHGINGTTQIPHETLQQIINGANKGNRGISCDIPCWSCS